MRSLTQMYALASQLQYISPEGKRKGSKPDRTKIAAKNRMRNKIARKSRKINRSPSNRAPWFWTTTTPTKRGWWAHVVVDTMSMPAMSPIVAFIVGNDLPPLEPACVRRLDDLGYVHDRAAICRVMDIPAMDRWSNRRLHRDERGGPI